MITFVRDDEGLTICVGTACLSPAGPSAPSLIIYLVTKSIFRYSTKYSSFTSKFSIHLGTNEHTIPSDWHWRRRLDDSTQVQSEVLVQVTAPRMPPVLGTLYSVLGAFAVIVPEVRSRGSVAFTYGEVL